MHGTYGFLCWQGVILDDCVVIAGSGTSEAVCPTPSGWAVCAPAGSARH